MFAFAPLLACALLLCALLSADAAAPDSPECVHQEIRNMKIDITNAVANGARFTDPVKAASAEECVSACCSAISNAGDRLCNLAVYDLRMSNSVQNCYLFMCPESQSCPMIPSPGVLSYSFWTEKEKSNPDSTKEDVQEIPVINDKVQNSPGKQSSPPFQADVLEEERLNQHNADEKSSPSDEDPQNENSEVKLLAEEDEADSPDHITSQLLHLANNIDKQLEKLESNSKEAKPLEPVELSLPPKLEKPTKSSTRKEKLSSDLKDTKSSKVLRNKTETLQVHYPTPELSTEAPSVRTSHQVSTAARRPVPNKKPAVVPSTAPPKERKVAKKLPISGTNSTKVLSSANSSVTVKNTRPGHLMVTTRVPTTSAVHQTKSGLLATQQNPSRTSLLKASKSTLKSDDRLVTGKDVQEADRSSPEVTSLELQGPFSPAGDAKETPRNLDALDARAGDGNKSGLVAALVFGVMFLVLIIGLVSHKISEARRRHQYTKLDYLINGMYVDT